MASSNSQRWTVLLATLLSVLTVTSVVAVGTAALDDGGTVSARPQAEPTGTLSGVINLSDAETQIVGADGDRAAYAARGEADLNGDGETDLLVGAPSNDTNGNNSGAVYVFYGPVPDGEVNASEADARLVGAPDDRAGFSVAAGDFDGDGVDDVAVGAPRNSSAADDAGAVYLLSGSDELSGTVVLPDESGATLTGAAGDDFAGFSVAALPAPSDQDDADGLLVGAPYSDSERGSNAGATYLVRDALADAGTPPNDPVSLLDAADRTFVGAAQGDLAGFSLASAGDTEGDGTPELLIGAPLNDSAARDAGAAYVLDASGDAVTVVGEGAQLAGVAAGDRAGRAVAGAGDTDADGSDDVVVGAPYNDSGGNNSGVAYIVTGPVEDMSLADAGVTLRGVSEGDYAGWAVSAAGSGDVTCDDRDDVLVGAPYNDSSGVNAGAAYLVYGGRSDGTYGLTTAEATFIGESAGDRAGWSVDGVNDTSGDDLEDVFVGAPGFGPNESGAGYLVNGTCPADADAATATPTDTATDKKTDTPTETETETETETDTPTKTKTETETETDTPTKTKTETETDTPTKTKTDTETETPDTDTPTTETPDTETPKTETPKTDTPDTETPDTETPDTETPKNDTETPKTDTPETETPKTDTPDTETPDTETPKNETETPGNETETPKNETEDQRAAISYVILCTQDENAVDDVNGTGADECPDGAKAFVRWEWNGNTFVPDGSADGTSMTATEFKDGNEPVEARWTSSTYNVTGAVVGAGGDTCTFTYDNASSGTVEACEGSAGQSAMSSPSSDFAPASVASLSALSLLAGAVLIGRRD